MEDEESHRRAAENERYQRLKSEGESFFPFSVVKDLIAAFVVLALLAFFAFQFGAPLEPPADAADASYNPRPEWYFLFLFEGLKFIPGRFESFAAVVLPSLGIVALALLPFLDRSFSRHPMDRLVWTGLALVVLGGIGALTIRGFRSPMTNPIVERDPKTLAGQRLYRDLNCAYCHTLAGQGGTVGPSLERAGAERNADWLARHFRDPQATTPGSIMPKLNLLPDEVESLVSYLQSQGTGAGAFTEDAARLFEENCAACHKLGSEGGDVGPDLSLIGALRDRAFLKRYIEDPARLNPGSAMPAFQGSLTEPQIEDLARFLAAKRVTAKPKR